jgi:glucosamine--fructose-6-phosphate aminotransferase (isomerizing)
MCGIIGYIGEKQAASIIIDGLKRLEYRGYDSTGIAVLNSDGLSIYKEKGKIDALTVSLKDNLPKGILGIGHVRWSTHGIPSKTNAHPHTDCQGKLAVVHNGIIENFQSLKTRLLKEGHNFKSETDTEVIAHLIEGYLTKNRWDLSLAVRLSLKELEGTYAIVLLCKDSPERLIATRNSSPLIVGMGKGENFIASDTPAILKHTRDIIILDDYQMVEVSKEGVKLTNLEGKNLSYKTTKIEWDAEAAEKTEFPHFMLKEIYEQPEVLRRILRLSINRKLSTTSPDLISFENLNISKREFKRLNRIIIQACGTSYHAGLIGKSILELFTNIPTEVEISSEFRYRQLLADEDTLILSITQSGETADTLLALRRAKYKSFKTLSICNVLGSTIARESDAVIYTHAGPEIGVASTKAYTAQLATLYLLAIYLGSLKGWIVPKIRKKLLTELERIPNLMQELINDQSAIINCAQKYHSSRDFLFLGRGLHYPNALEGALKLKEIAYIHASGHPAGEMKHGPIALIDDKMPIVCIATKGETYEKMLSNIQEVKARRGMVIAIANRGDGEIKRYVDEVIYIPETEETFSPLLVALPMQLLAYHIAAKRGCEIDQPRNLAKSVTVE